MFTLRVLRDFEFYVAQFVRDAKREEWMTEPARECAQHLVLMALLYVAISNNMGDDGSQVTSFTMSIAFCDMAAFYLPRPAQLYGGQAWRPNNEWDPHCTIDMVRRVSTKYMTPQVTKIMTLMGDRIRNRCNFVVPNTEATSDPGVVKQTVDNVLEIFGDSIVHQKTKKNTT